MTRFACFVALVAGISGAHAASVDHVGRGVYRFASQSGCPFTDAAPGDCNRIALDAPDVGVSIDADAHVIVFSAAASHHSDEVLGDVLLQGTGLDADGQRVPLGVHLLLYRKGLRWERDVYTHVPVRGRFTDVRIDPYRIRVKEDGAENGGRDLLTPEETRRLFEQPSLLARLSRYLVTVRETDPQQPGASDITIGFGLGSLAKSVARARLTAAGTNGAHAGQVLSGTGTWAIRIDALSDHIPLWSVRRDLFLFGLEDRPVFEAMRARGLKKNDWFELGAHNGQGYLKFNGREEPFPGAVAAGREFMQESFMGVILGWRHQ